MLFDSSDQFVNGGGMNSIFVWLVLIVERMWKMRKHGRQFYLIFVLFDLSSFGFEFFWYVVLVWWDASYFSSSLIYVLFELMRSEWKLHEFCSILVFYLLYTQFFFFCDCFIQFLPAYTLWTPSRILWENRRSRLLNCTTKTVCIRSVGFIRMN